MQMIDCPLGITDWFAVERTEHKGETGFTDRHARHVGSIRARLVEYAPGYPDDHGCITGASRDIFLSAWRASCIPNFRFDADS